MRFDAALFLIAAALSICFCFYAFKNMWDIGKKEKVYCLCTIVFTILFIIVGWGYGARQGIL